MSDALDAQIGPIKGNPLYKGLAKFFSGLDSYARDPNNILAQALPLPDGAGVGITSGWSTLMGLPEAARFWNDRHGGFPLTEGKNQTLKLSPDVLEGGLASIPFISGPANTARKASLKAADKALDLSKGLPKGQLNALYGGKAGQPAPKDPDIFLSHGTSAGKLRMDKTVGNSYETDLPQELYNISMALTRGKLSDFGGADTILVPQHGRFEPKLDQTIITATDSYSPRYSSAMGGRSDGGTKLQDFLRGFVSKDEYQRHLQKKANIRLADQFVPIYEGGGLFQEGDSAISKGLAGFKKFREATQVPFRGGATSDKVANSYDFFRNRVALSPHFQSLAHYETSPYGGGLLGSQSGHTTLAKAETTTAALLDKLAYENVFGDLDSLGGIHNGRIESLKALASGFHKPYDRSAKGRAFDKEREPFDFSRLRYELGGGDYGPMTPEQIAEIRQTAGKILQQIKTAPSDYGELKRFGQTKLNPDTFAGIITNSDADWLPTAALKRGLAFERLPYSSPASEAVGIANDMQNAGKNPSILSAGLPGGSRKTPDMPSYADYKAAVDKVKTAQKALSNAPGDAAAQEAFKAAAAEWNSKSQSFVNASHISTGSQGAMAKYLEKQLGEMSPVSAPPVPPAGGFPKTFGDKFLDETATAANQGGDFDYLTDKLLTKILDYAKTTGNFELQKSSQHALDIFMGKTPGDIIDASTPVLKEMDKVKASWKASPKPVKAFSLYDISPGDYSPDEIKGFFDQHYAAGTNYLGVSELAEKFPNLSDSALAHLSDYGWSKVKASNAAEKAKGPEAWEKFLQLAGKPDNSPITKQGLENMLGFASGDIPWHAAKTDGGWNFAYEFQKDFPGLTDAQAEILQEISFKTLMAKKHVGTHLDGAWAKDISELADKLMSTLK